MLASVLYSIGIVELELESTSAVVLLLFIIPLAFSLSAFLLWIVYSLNGKQKKNDTAYFLTQNSNHRSFTCTETKVQVKDV